MKTVPILLLLAACHRPGAPAAAPAVQDGVTRHAAVARVVAIGDVHGDLAATRAALRLAGAIDADDRWIGRDLVIVQTGDELDRGDGERAILALTDRLEADARAAGGAVYALDGNHEVMNVAGDFRYVTPGGFADFAADPDARPDDPRVAAFPEIARARASVFMPGAPGALRLARRSLYAIVGDTAFVHGGISAEHVRYGLDRMDRELHAWMRGEAASLPAILENDDAPDWTRRWAGAPTEADCAALGEALAALGVKRLVIAHTVQPHGIGAACDGRVWRIDVGLAALYGGPLQVLEIVGDDVKPLTGDRP